MAETLDKENREDTLFPWHLLQETAVFLWKDWSKDMEAVYLDGSRFSLCGECPHPDCRRSSVFFPVGGPHQDQIGLDVRNQQVVRFVEIAQCQGCRKFLLAIATKGVSEGTFRYVTHYPLGTPDDTVADEIPDHIKLDFKEALRCLWIDAFNATAEMCRRALEASCIEQGAPKNKRVLEDKIDWLADQRKITPFLQQVAHKIRLGGNRGAHPPEDAPAPGTPEGEYIVIEKPHAEAIVDFTKEFFHHIYVIAKRLDKYDFSKPKAASVAATATPAPATPTPTKTVGGGGTF